MFERDARRTKSQIERDQRIAELCGTCQQTALTSRKRTARAQTLSQRCHNYVRTRGLDGGRQDTVSAGQAAPRVNATQGNSAYVRLAVKWSQVQILSARHCQPDTCQRRFSCRERPDLSRWRGAWPNVVQQAWVKRREYVVGYFSGFGSWDAGGHLLRDDLLFDVRIIARSCSS